MNHLILSPAFRIRLLSLGLVCCAGVVGSVALAEEPAARPKMPELKPLFDYPVRDTSVCLGPDGIYYLIGTTGHPTWWNTNEGVRMWKSKDLKTWESMGLVWSYEKNATWQKVKTDQAGKKTADSAIWAPELHYFKKTYWITYSLNCEGTGILKSESGKSEGPYVDIKQDGPLTGGIDASLFADDDGSVYFVWANGKIARLKDDMSGFAETPRQLKPANADEVGFEGACITKINGRYHLICANFNNWDGKTQTYDCMAASSEKIYGPYGDRYLAIPGGGHNVLFMDTHAKWWSTYFGNDDNAPFKERPAILRIEIDKENRIRPLGEPAKVSLGQPFWRSKVMENEPVLFVQDEGKSAASGRLLFVPSAKPTVMAPDLAMSYEEGRDYLWKPGSDTIELSAGSRIPFKTAAQMAPPPGSPNTLMGVLFSEGRFFHDLQVQVTYPHVVAWPLKDEPHTQPLTRSLAKLKATQPLKLVALGDSITEGYNASGFKESEAPPYQPSYPQLVADALEGRFNAPVTLANLGRAGTVATWGLEMVPQVAEEKPDLVLLAFGMNHGEAAPDFEAAMRKLRDAVQAACPEADIVLVAPMTGNVRGFPAERFTGYRDALRNLTAANVALADVTAPWLELLKRKAFSDLSGNNINHPNDFGHRLYAQVICQLFPL